MARRTSSKIEATPKRKTPPRIKGRTLGLGVCGYFAVLFEANELAPKKITDEQIAAKIKLEFPSAKTEIGPGAKYTVNVYRQKYNRGIFTGHVPPERFSFRYNAQGQIIHPGKGNRQLLPEEVKACLKNHAAYRKQMIRQKLGK